MPVGKHSGCANSEIECCKWEDLSDLESIVNSMIKFLSNCGTATDQGVIKEL